MFDVEEAYYTLVEKAEKQGKKKKHPKNCDCPECKKRRAKRKKIAIGAGVATAGGLGAVAVGSRLKTGYDAGKDVASRRSIASQHNKKADHKEELLKKMGIPDWNEYLNAPVTKGWNKRAEKRAEIDRNIGRHRAMAARYNKRADDLENHEVFGKGIYGLGQKIYRGVHKKHKGK